MEKFGNIQVKFCSPPGSENHPMYPGFKSETKILPKGTVLKEGALALPCDISWERDIPVKLRDGVTIYADIYKPAGAKYLLPAIIAAGPFGKNGGLNRMTFNMAPWRHGVPQSTVSSLEKFEGPDPAYWCNHGYAIVHPDMRGTWKSEGDTYINSTIDGRDGYDLVEWIAEQEWSNKRVSMAGNSYLAQTQWFVGAEKPPHLTCLAPWEGCNDLYNESAMRGGIPNPEFMQSIVSICGPGIGRTEDIAAMAGEYPLWNEYWEDRRAKLGQIDVPLYIVASWTNALHTKGTFRGFVESRSKDKWLRVHNSHEWPDLYYPQNTEDLRKFYDYYMKDKQNDWIFTPKVRLTVLNPGGVDIVNRPEAAFPLARQVTERLHLDAQHGSMSWSQPISVASSTIFAASTGEARFSYTFDQRRELVGYFALKLWVEAIGNDDIDLFAKFSKYSAKDNLLETVCIDVGYLQDDPAAEQEKLHKRHSTGDKLVDVFFAEGSTGRLRVSHRSLNSEKSTPHQPVHTHANEEKLKPGEIVPVEMEMWPHGMIFEENEKIVVTVAGHNLRPEVMWRTPPPKTLNKGELLIHTGSEYDSHFVVPLIPLHSDS